MIINPTRFFRRKKTTKKDGTSTISATTVFPGVSLKTSTSGGKTKVTGATVSTFIPKQSSHRSGGSSSSRRREEAAKEEAAKKAAEEAQKKLEFQKQMEREFSAKRAEKERLRIEALKVELLKNKNIQKKISESTLANASYLGNKGDNISVERVRDNRTGEQVVSYTNLRTGTTTTESFQRQPGTGTRVVRTGGLVVGGYTKKDIKNIQENLPPNDTLIYDSRTLEIKGIRSGTLNQSIRWDAKSLEDYNKRLTALGIIASVPKMSIKSKAKKNLKDPKILYGVVKEVAKLIAIEGPKQITKVLKEYGLSLAKGTVKVALIGTFGAALADAALLVFIDMLDTRIKSEEELALEHSLLVLGSVPKFDEE
jgi:hypothetical protein